MDYRHVGPSQTLGGGTQGQAPRASPMSGIYQGGIGWHRPGSPGEVVGLARAYVRTRANYFLTYLCESWESFLTDNPH